MVPSANVRKQNEFDEPSTGPKLIDYHLWLTEVFSRKGMVPALRILCGGDRSQVEITEAAALFGVSEGAVIGAIRTGRTHGILWVARLPVAGRKYRIGLTRLGRMLVERSIIEWSDPEFRRAIVSSPGSPDPALGSAAELE